MYLGLCLRYSNCLPSPHCRAHVFPGMGAPVGPTTHLGHSSYHVPVHATIPCRYSRMQGVCTCCECAFRFILPDTLQYHSHLFSSLIPQSTQEALSRANQELKHPKLSSLWRVVRSELGRALLQVSFRILSLCVYVTLQMQSFAMAHVTSIRLGTLRKHGNSLKRWSGRWGLPLKGTLLFLSTSLYCLVEFFI